MIRVLPSPALRETWIQDKARPAPPAGTAISGQYANVGTATGTPPGNLPAISDTDPSHYFGSNASIVVLKKTNGQDADTPPGPYLPVGSSVAWTYLVSNEGNVALNSIQVSDNKGVTVSCPKSSLAPAESMTCTGSGTAVAGQYANLANVTGTPPLGAIVNDTDPSHYFGAQPGLNLVKKTNGQDANSTPGVYIKTGDPVTWSYEVMNTGNVPLTIVRVKDDNGTPGDPADDVTVCVISSLSVSANSTCTRLGSAVAGQYSNIGTATGTPPGGLPDVSDTDPSHYFGASPSLALVKQTNGQDANTSPGPYLPAGSQVTWAYQLINNGNVTLTNLVVKDDAGTPGNPSDDYTICNFASLAPDATQSCTKQLPAIAGQYANIGSVIASAPVGPSVTASDPSHYFGTTLSITLIKKVNGADANTTPGPYILVGELVNWAYEVSNGSNVPLSLVRVTDDNGTPTILTDDKLVCTIPTLAAGAAQTCTTTSTAQANQYTNIGKVTGTPPGGLADISDTDPASYFGAAPSILLVKKTNGQDANAPPGPNVMQGNAVSWTYVVNNNGNVPLSSVNVTDNKGVAVSCPGSSLPVGQSLTCNASGSAQPGQYANLGTATGLPPAGLATVSFTDPSHYLGITSQPAVDIQKYTNGVNADSVPGPLILSGQQITWEYQIANIGNVKLNNLVVRDDNGTPASTGDDFTACTITSLNAGASQTCSYNGVATNGQYSNTATVTGDAQGGGQVSDNDASYYYGASPAIQLVKKTNGIVTTGPPGIYLAAGSPITWSYQVNNPGNVDLSNVQVVDDNGSPSNYNDDATVCTIQKLTPGGTQICTRPGTAQAGQYANSAYAAGTPPAGLQGVNDTDAGYYFGAQLAISLVKKTNNQDANSAPGPFLISGDLVSWSYLVTNNSNVSLSSLAVIDDNGTASTTADDIIVCTIPNLVPGNSQTCQLNGNAAPGQYVNIGRVSGTPPGGLAPPSATDPSHYFGVQLGISLVKKTNSQIAHTPPGPNIIENSPVTWSYEITNLGNVTLSGLVVKDDNGTAGNPSDDITVCTIASLAAGSAQTCLEGGNAVLGLYRNVGSVTGSYNSQIVTASDVSHYTGTPAGIRIFLPWVKR